jgi:hypothetical protein
MKLLQRIKDKRNKPCRVCGIIPEAGYSMSKFIRHDWICTPCDRLRLQVYRAKRRELCDEAVAKQLKSLNELTDKVIEGGRYDNR